MHPSDERVIVILLVGAIAGFLAGKFVRGNGLGLVGDAAVGVVGALLGDWLLPRFHIHFGTGVISLIASAGIGAVVVLLMLRVAGASGLGASR